MSDISSVSYLFSAYFLIDKSPSQVRPLLKILNCFLKPYLCLRECVHLKQKLQGLCF